MSLTQLRRAGLEMSISHGNITYSAIPKSKFDKNKIELIKSTSHLLKILALN